MAEVMLALDGNALRTTVSLQQQTLSALGGYLIDPALNLHWQDQQDSKHLNFVQTAILAKHRLRANRILLDPRLDQDKTEKMTAEICYYLDHSPNDPRFVNRYKPTHLSVSFYANREPMRVFKEEVEQRGVSPVCFTTSSRSSELDYSDRSSRPEELARKSTSVLSSLGYGAVICAAKDAPIVKEENPDMFVFATGGILHPGEPTHHLRTAIIDEVAPYVDVFIQGHSVYSQNDTDSAIAERITAANKAS